MYSLMSRLKFGTVTSDPTQPTRKGKHQLPSRSPNATQPVGWSNPPDVRPNPHRYHYPATWHTGIHWRSTLRVVHNWTFTCHGIPGISFWGINFWGSNLTHIIFYPVEHLSHLLSCPFEVKHMAIWRGINPFLSLLYPTLLRPCQRSAMYIATNIVKGDEALPVELWWDKCIRPKGMDVIKLFAFCISLVSQQNDHKSIVNVQPPMRV